MVEMWHGAHGSVAFIFLGVDFIFGGWVSFLEVWVSFLVMWVAGFHCSLVWWLWFLWVSGGGVGSGLMVVVLVVLKVVVG